MSDITYGSQEHFRIEIFRGSIPAKWIISDNAGQHYKTMMGKMSRISRYAHLVASGEISIGGFEMPDPKAIRTLTDKFTGDLTLELQQWKGSNIRFDLQNYGKTFKPVIDMCTDMGYWADDDWREFRGVLYTGGGKSRWPSCNLDDEILQDSTSNNNSLLRIFITR